MTKRKRKPKSDEQHRMELSQYLTRRGPGDEDHAPTPERVRHAEQSGEIVRANVIYSDAGFPTGNFYWRISPVVDELHRRGTLTREEYDAASRFMRHWSNGIHRGAPTVRYAPRYDGEVADMTPSERAWHYASLAKNAFKSVDGLLQPALAWLIQTMGDPLPLKELGAYYSPGRGSQTQSSQGALALKLACVKLCDYYGYEHHLTRKRIERLSEQLLAKLTLAASE